MCCHELLIFPWLVMIFPPHKVHLAIIKQDLLSSKSFLKHNCKREGWELKT